MATDTMELHESSPLETSQIRGEPQVAKRFHDMDSLRAAMMLLGITFHAAWFFNPIWFGHPLSDAGAATGYLFFFCWVHQFRMQVFFLIAGFFACLLIEKRGMWSFIVNRWQRVAIPLIVAMLTLYPLMKLQYIRGGNISGRILSDQTVWQQFVAIWPEIDWWNEWPVHFWFLECLLILYAISLVLKSLCDRVLDRSGNMRLRISQGVNALTGSHWGPWAFALPIAVCLAYDLTWFGIDSGPLYPLWGGVFAYWVIFAIGWCLYRQPNLIDRFVARWPAYLIVGSLMSLMLCGYFNNILMSGKISWFYPAVLDTEIEYDILGPKLLAASVEASDSSTGPAAEQTDEKYRVLWRLLSPAHQRFVGENAAPSSDQLMSLAGELTKVTVFNADFPKLMQEFSPPSPNQSEASLNSGELASTELDPAANRELLASLFPGEIYGYWSPPWYIRGGYFYVYAVASWLMVFGMLGLFRRYLHHPSATIRYLADSSYWLYLIHLPLQFEFSLHVANWPGGFWKFLLVYNVLAFAIMLPSYHFLVRPTWLGKILNGRAYPLALATMSLLESRSNSHEQSHS